MESGPKPEVVISCGTKDLKKYYKKFIRQGLSSLKNFKYGPPILKVKPSVLSSTSGLAATAYMMEADVSLLEEEIPPTSHDTKTSVSASILGARMELKNNEELSDTMVVTVGGAIVVDDKLFGLTVGHIIAKGSSSWELGKTAVGLEINGHDLGTNRAMVSQFGRDSPTSESVDWALVDLGLGSPTYNYLQLSDKKTESIIRGPLVSSIITEEQFPHLPDIETYRRVRCFIVTYQGLVPGFVALGVSTLVLSTHPFEVLVVDIMKKLPPGSSGSWVIVGNRLLGTVIAKQDRKRPRAFVIPIETTLREIQKYLGASRVALPSALDSHIFASLQGVDRLPRWLGPTDHDHRLGFELFSALRQAERNVLNNEGASHIIPEGMGWVGVSREEVIGFSPGLDRPLGKTKLKVRSYESLTGLKLSTIRSLIRIGHIFPIRHEVRVQLNEWMRHQEPRHHFRSRAIAAQMILDECLDTEAGENLLFLFLVLKRMLEIKQGMLDIYIHAVWFADIFISLFESLRFPPTCIPSRPQIQAFARGTLTCFKNLRALPPGSSKAEVIPFMASTSHAEGSTSRVERVIEEDTPLIQLEEAGFLSRLLLQLSDISHDGCGATALVCAGDDAHMALVATIAHGVFGLPVDIRLKTGGSSLYPSFKQLHPELVSKQAPGVFVFMGTDFFVAEIMQRDSLAFSSGSELRIPPLYR